METIEFMYYDKTSMNMLLGDKLDNTTKLNNL